MKLRIAGTFAVLIALAGCTDPITSDPVTGSIFAAPTGATGALPAPAETTTEPLDATGIANSGTTTEVIAQPGYDPALAMVEDTPGSNGLLEREPDTCRLSDYRYLQGQNSAAVQGAGITRPYRVIGPEDIVTQEYNPMRVNFYTDNSGRIGRVSCG